MRSITKKTLVDRLAASLEAHGVSLKRAKVIEIAAQAFGHADSNHLAAAASAGDLDPPASPRESQAFCRIGALHVLRDPTTDRLFGVDEASFEAGASPWVLSPYGGGVLALPAAEPIVRPPYVHGYALRDADGSPHDPSRFAGRPVSEVEPRAGTRRFDDPAGTYADPAGRFRDPTVPFQGMDDDNRPYVQIGDARDVVSLDAGHGIDGVVGLEEHGLERFSAITDVDVQIAVAPWMTCTGPSLVDGRLHMTFAAEKEYDGHFGATRDLADMMDAATAAAPRIVATGAVLRWVDDSRFGNVEIRLHVPVDAMAGLRDHEELADAVCALMKGDDAPCDHLFGTVADREAAAPSEGLPPHRRGASLWADGNRADARSIVPVDRPATHADHRVREMVRLLVPAIPLSDSPDDVLVADGIAMVDGEPHLRLFRDRRCRDAASREAAAAAIDALHDRLAEPLRRIGAIQTRMDHGTSLTHTLLFPFGVVRMVDDAATWTHAVQHLLGRPGMETVEAVFHPQAWQRDYAIDVDPKGPVRFDVTWEILMMGRAEAEAMRDDSSDSDDLLDAALAPEWIHEWSGPYRISASDSIEDFHEALDAAREEELDDLDDPEDGDDGDDLDGTQAS